MIPPAHRRPLLLNACLLAAVVLLFALLYLLPEKDSRYFPSSTSLVSLLLLLSVYLVGMLLNGTVTLVFLVKGRRSAALLLYLAAMLLWGLAFRHLWGFLGHLGGKIGG